LVNSAIGNVNGKSFLDVACGMGIWGFQIRMKWKVKYLVGIEIWRPYIDFLKKHNIYDELILADVRYMPLKEKCFDIVCACEILEHLKKDEGFAFLEEIEKLSRGKIVISTPNFPYPQDVSGGNPFQKHVSFWKSSEIKKLGYNVRGVGFSVFNRKIVIFSRLLSGFTYKSFFARFSELIVAYKNQ